MTQRFGSVSQCYPWVCGQLTDSIPFPDLGKETTLCLSGLDFFILTLFIITPVTQESVEFQRQ